MLLIDMLEEALRLRNEIKELEGKDLISDGVWSPLLPCRVLRQPFVLTKVVGVFHNHRCPLLRTL